MSHLLDKANRPRLPNIELRVVLSAPLVVALSSSLVSTRSSSKSATSASYSRSLEPYISSNMPSGSMVARVSAISKSASTSSLRCSRSNGEEAIVCPLLRSLLLDRDRGGKGEGGAELGDETGSIDSYRGIGNRWRNLVFRY